MIHTVKSKAAEYGDRAEIISAGVLSRIIKDMEDIKRTGWLNDFQNYILDNLYSFKLPEWGFGTRSIIIIATPGSAVNLIFNKGGRRIKTVLPPTYNDYTTAPGRIENYLKNAVNTYGYHIIAAPQLPYKLLAARSGLSKYGRNNITYIEGIGSYYKLVGFYSDLPCEAGATDNEISQMEICRNCTLCIRSCPTGAITKNRYLIDNQRCLTYFNEAGGWDFPEWIEESAHNSIYGCTRCQSICPANPPQSLSVTETVEFSEKETHMLMNETPIDNFSNELKEKLRKLDMEGFLSALPRNLKILFKREEQS